MVETPAETQMAQALDALVGREFPQSRGRESRLDVYLALDELLCLEDTEASVLHLQSHVTALLGEVRHDLQRCTASDVLHAALRSLSYLMHHRSVASVFSDQQISVCLGEINFEAERHHFLPRTVEGLVQAVVNPFKSRAIEVQALKGLHLLLIEYPQQLAYNAAVLIIWLRPIASRLASSEAATSTQVRLVIQEMSQHLSKSSDGTLQMVQDCIVEYVLPVMKTYMDKDRPKDALHLWQLTLVLLKTRLSANFAMLNQLLYVPERCMRHEDAVVRLMSMQAWAGLVDVFRDSDEWLFKKPVVHLLMGPVLACLKEELLLNIVEAAFVSWRKIVSVAVRDFNEFCEKQDDSIKVAQQNKQRWMRWLHEVILAPILVLVKVRLGKNSHSHGEATVFEAEQFIDFAKQIWKTNMCEGDKRRDNSLVEVKVAVSLQLVVPQRMEAGLVGIK